ncbi:hypothetical protein PSD17_18760 [Pseudonocardia sp. D17]|nr:hypothetical protein PSD17_18760 [Pseudonocardia sp. D17]
MLRRVFGILRPCRHTLPGGLKADWTGHLCGLCLALRDEHGQLARTVTNYDGLVVSVLVDAQTPAAPRRRRAGPCPLRGFRTAGVATGEGARLAAAVSLVLASAKLADHAADGDGAMSRRPVAAAAQALSRRWAGQARSGSAALGFDAGVLLDAVARQPAAELSAGSGVAGLLAATEPTETATAAAFAHTAVLAGRPGNVAPLAEAGRLFGRLAHLLDAVADRRADDVAGAWNPLTATGTDLVTARRLADDATLGVRLALADVDWERPRLVHRLLVHELERAVGHAFAHAGGPGKTDPETAPEKVDLTKHRDPAGDTAGGRFGNRRGLLGGCAAAIGLCCTCQLCCADEFPGPWSGQRRLGLCANNDCGFCDCCDGCPDCCDCCDGCDCCDCNC